MNQQRLIRFTERLAHGSERTVFLILDNLRFHDGKLAAAWLESHKDKIGVLFLPPYAPEYNPDEYWNHALKISVHSGQLPYTAEDISHKIWSFMCKLQHHPSAVSNFFLLFNYDGNIMKPAASHNCCLNIDLGGHKNE